ncbi:MAG TPA: cytochrome c [Gammaproteobacteria bacterium]|nr:cytochrome c [Gammaproteobacteria bacterium]
MKKLCAWLGLAALLGFALPVARAADPAAGQKLYSATCIACHGQNGISIAPIYPNIAGQKDQYLIAQLKAFRDGTRVNPIMSPMAKGLTDTDIANLAAYLSALKTP